MPTAPQEPGRLNVSLVRGDSWSRTLDFDEPADITGYTFSAGLYSVVTGTLVQAITCTVISAVGGQLGLSLTYGQTAALDAGTYHFRVNWGPTARRIYEGYCEVLP